MRDSERLAAIGAALLFWADWWTLSGGGRHGGNPSTWALAPLLVGIILCRKALTRSRKELAEKTTDPYLIYPKKGGLWFSIGCFTIWGGGGTLATQSLHSVTLWLQLIGGAGVVYMALDDARKAAYRPVKRVDQ